MQLLFVYNAGADRLSVALDFLHKIIRPSTYACNLCAITYGTFNMYPEWEQFIKSLPVETLFLHKDEFKKEYPDFVTEFPVAFIVANGLLETVITPQEMQTLNLEQLKQRVTEIVNFNLDKTV